MNCPFKNVLVLIKHLQEANSILCELRFTWHGTSMMCDRVHGRNLSLEFYPKNVNKKKPILVIRSFLFLYSSRITVFFLKDSNLFFPTLLSLFKCDWSTAQPKISRENGQYPAQSSHLYQILEYKWQFPSPFTRHYN